jgi:hypothetical protein
LKVFSRFWLDELKIVTDRPNNRQRCGDIEIVDVSESLESF